MARQHVGQLGLPRIRPVAPEMADGVAEVGSIGGYVKEYQVDVDPDATRAYGVTLDQVFHAVMAANIDVGAKTLEINRVEYFIRGIGFIKALEDIRSSVVKVGADNVPVLVEHVAEVGLGPVLYCWIEELKLKR